MSDVPSKNQIKAAILALRRAATKTKKPAIVGPNSTALERFKNDNDRSDEINIVADWLEQVAGNHR